MGMRYLARSDDEPECSSALLGRQTSRQASGRPHFDAMLFVDSGVTLH